MVVELYNWAMYIPFPQKHNHLRGHTTGQCISPFFSYVFVLTVYYSINVLPTVSKAVLLKASFLWSRFSPYHVSTYLIMFLGCVMFHLFLSKTRRLESSIIPASSYLSIVNIWYHDIHLYTKGQGQRNEIVHQICFWI